MSTELEGRTGTRSEAEARAILRDERVRFLRLVFSDIHGVIKNVEVPDSQFDKALAGEIMFDGSSIEGFVRIQESDMLLRPDLDSLRIFPIDDESRDRLALLICDVANPDGSPFGGDPRAALRRVKARAAALGYTAMMGTEAEFFLFQSRADGTPTTDTHDQGSYFDLSPVDRGEDARRDIVNVLEKMGFEVEAAHHEVAPGQHEIDFKYADTMTTADNLIIFRHVVKKVALKYNLHATFMPKPLYGVNGSGMHTHQSLFTGTRNAFDDPGAAWGLSDIARWYIGGVLAHAKAICAVTNPTVNSYKRLVPGYEAPTNIAWSERNRSPLARVPARRGTGTRVEIRMPDPSCNPYLAFAAMLQAGLDGIEKKIDAGPPINKDIFKMSDREKRRLRIDNLPANLNLAVQELEKDRVILDALGDHIATHFIEAKLADWHEYISVVHPWELKKYLGMY